MKQLSASVTSIQTQLKRKADEDEPTAQCGKKVRATDEISSYSDGNSDIFEDEIDCLLMNDDRIPDNPTDLSCIDELTSFFIEETEWGENVKKGVAQAINKRLRSQADPEKMKALLDNYKCPQNIDNLQVPRVDSFLWDQLKTVTKGQDVGKQKTISLLNQSLVPLVRALDHVSGNASPDVASLKKYIGDAIKMMFSEINKINVHRRELIKKELFPKFRSLCTDDQPISATGLFGDNLADQTKNLDTSKAIQMTSKGQTSGQKSF